MNHPNPKRARKRFEREHRSRTGRDEVLMRNGKEMAIIRPLDPALALRLVGEIPNGTPHEESKRAFDAILDAQPYRFIGMATKGGYIIHPQTGARIGKLQPGDSFVDYDQMQKYAERIPDPTIN
jgi:hypothetical protein